MAPDSDLLVDEVTRDPEKGQKKSFFEVTRGQIVFYAIRLFSVRDIRMKVKTPTATVGIRGTKFGTEIQELPYRSHGFVRHRVASSDPMALAANDPDGSLTRVYVAEGRVGVTSDVDAKAKEVATNEVLEAGPEGLGTVFFDPARVNAFMMSVEGPFMGRPQGTPPRTPDLNTVKSQQQQEEIIQQIDQIEDAKHLETQKDLDQSHDDHSSHPPEGSLPGGPGCGGPCP
jgi:hypothetical protein